MRLLFASFILMLLSTTISYTQRICASSEVYDRLVIDDPNTLDNQRKIELHTNDFVREIKNTVSNRSNITIPVVFHVLYKTQIENISEAQLLSQIEILNEDFNGSNNDLKDVPSIFKNITADIGITFCLASQDPNGISTNGITRKFVNSTNWGTNDNVKKSTKGGVDAWDPSQYLNIWVCNIGNGVLGYAQFPGGPVSTDGVVLDYRSTGIGGTASPPFHLGRTATHEIGHWLNLKHIWGDQNCGDDFVSDTPQHRSSNKGCPSFPLKSDCNGNHTKMTMNYMDYTNDACMFMFTQGQKNRIQAIFSQNGARTSLLASKGCMSTTGENLCVTPKSINITNITSNSATVTWDKVGSSYEYILSYKLTSSTRWTDITTNASSVNINGLRSATNYNIRLSVNCSTAKSSASEILKFTTLSIVGCDDNFENNDSKNNAKLIPSGVDIFARIGSFDDVDWFKFTNNETKKNIKVTLSNLPDDYDLKVYRENTMIKVSEFEDLKSEVIVFNNVLPYATYYIQIYGYSEAKSDNCYIVKAEIDNKDFEIPEETSEITPSNATKDIKLFPNPSNSVINIVLPLKGNDIGQIDITDISGKHIYRKEVIGSLHTYSEIDINELPNGIYILTFVTGEAIFSKKFVKIP